MKRLSYIGVSGFTSRAQVDAALEAVPADAPPQSFMVGVLASSKTLCGQPNKYPVRYPKHGDIAAIFSDDPRCLNLVHVNHDSEPSAVDGKRIPTEVDMWRAFTAGGPLCHGVQLNGATSRMKWESLHVFRSMCPTALRVVLQMGPRWMASHQDTEPLGSMAMMSAFVTDFLIDLSGGRGVAMKHDVAKDLVVKAHGLLYHYGIKNIGIGIAGGLCAETLSAVMPLVREFDLSIDAEGRLRNDRDELDPEKVRAYLRAAGES